MVRPTDAVDIVEEVRQDHHSKVRVGAIDLDGILRGKYMHKSKFLSAVERGFGFCNVVFGWDCADVCYDNVAYTGWHTGYPDATATLDLHTYRRVGWDNDVAFFLADFVDSAGAPLGVCPRQLLKKQIDKARGLGFEPKFGLEFEWFNFRESPESWADKKGVEPTPLTPGMFGYSLSRAGYASDYFNALLDKLAAFDIPLEGLHTETGPGVYEAAIVASDALSAADRAVLFKAAVKEIAYPFGIMPTFMAKWNAQLPGCSGHIHQSLLNEAGTTNLFSDARAPQRMSKLFCHYLAGQLKLLPELLALYAPTVNSYKRLVEGLWAPTSAAWGLDNRTTALRVIATDPKSTRLETRVPGADVNPYLGVAAALASGLWGIEHELELSDAPISGSAYAAKDTIALPRTLDEATQALAGSEVATELFGADFVDHFVKTRQWEWRQFRSAVTDWELKRYFEIV